jgi:histidinol-phosphate aminotransferase
MSSERPDIRDARARAAALVRPEIAAMSGYVPGEQPTDPRVVKLNTNENPYPPAPAVRAAIAAACDRLRLYPDPTARALRERAAVLYGADPEGLVVGNGSDELLTLLVRAIVAPGEPVAYPVPTYSLYDTLVALQGGVPVHLPYPEDWSLPAELFAVEARLVLLCNPNAPSGTWAPPERIEELVKARRCVVVVDEAYADFARGNAMRLVGRHPNLVVLRTLSKSYSLAGLRVGLAATTPELAAQLQKAKDSYNVSTLAQAGALAALENQQTMLDHVARVCATRSRLERELGALGFAVVPSETNFVFARRPGEPAAPIAAELKERGILVRYFASLPDALRISIGTDQEIDRLLAALRDVLRG